MSRRRVDVLTAAPGYITDGHLHGHRAFVVHLCAGDGEEAPTYHVLADRLRRSGLGRLHVIVAKRGMLAALDLVHYLTECCEVTPTLSFPPGEYAPTEALVYESVLTISPDDVFSAEDLDRRAGSVSLGYWPGSSMLAMLAANCDAPYGQFMVLPKEDIGTAKAWQATARDTEWQLVPAYDFESVTSEEARSLVNGAGHGKAG